MIRQKETMNEYTSVFYKNWSSMGLQLRKGIRSNMFTHKIKAVTKDYKQSVKIRTSQV